jgi:glutaredoxin
MMKKLSYVYLPLLFLIYLVVETVLKLNHSSLCHSKGCELAGGLLNIPAIELNYLGIAGAVLLLILGYLTYIRAFSKRYFFILLSSMIVFETIMIGYQYFASPMLCKFCLGVYGSLLTIAIFTMRERFFFLLPAIVAPLTALYLLAIPMSKSFITDNGNYLIQSQTCPHCKKVKEFLKSKNIEFKKLDAKSIEARNFIKYMAYKTIPVLIVKDGRDIKIINGDEDIIRYFETPKKESREDKDSSNSSTSTTAPVDLLSGAGDSSGCGIELLEEKSCDKDKK